MSRYTKAKNKLARREGEDLGLKTPGSKAHASLLRRMKIPPGQHGQKRSRKVSDYGKQLREKQKVRRIYGIIEQQFKRYYQEASKFHGVTGEALLAYLEQRLDNVIYRLGFAPTRAAARQLVRHGHIKVNDRRIDIPSYQVKLNDVVRLRDQALKVPLVLKQLGEKQSAPAWLTVKGNAGKIISRPKRADIIEPIDEQLIVEYYSR
ncbi:MAG TPA: 30S ribosomal protein S4 [Patescibacteria group bacterium]|nr:30S ribosomal protein S4 [Patescibacteria group bacterium]